jgi:predicted lipoprotein with Yx(FWY)xxD motif
MKQILLVAAATLALAGCGSSNNTSSTAGDTSAPSGSSTSAASAASAQQASGGLSTSASSLGTIVVDTSGRTVYLYDVDKQGATSSACTGGCASAWPAVPAGSVATGVTGTVGSITGVDGKAQATLDGWPLYYYAKDTAAGDTTGQGVGGIWWVLSPAGQKMTGSGGASAATSESGDDSGGHGGGY